MSALDAIEPELPEGADRTRSLSNVHRSIPVSSSRFFIRRLLAFIGPGYLVAVGYMDPGNWATDIAGGAQFAYLLLSVVVIASLLAIYLQSLAAQLGIATGKDLAQLCASSYKPSVRIFLWLSAEVAIVACDLAEVLGAAIAFNLLFHIPLIIGVLITALDVLLVLALQHKGFRWIEMLVISLIVTMTVIFIILISMSSPQWADVFKGCIPSPLILTHAAMLTVALGILGATVMPHNLYFHSAIIQTRRFGSTFAEKKEAIKLAIIDNAVALSIALFVNAAILIVAAATFYVHHQRSVGDIQTAFELLTPILGTTLAVPLFAVALLASGQNSTLTGTLAGQVIMEGFTSFRIQPWLRRMISRMLAIVPAAIIIWIEGNKGINSLMIWSQVILSIQLPMAVIPLVQFTADRKKMGGHHVSRPVMILGWFSAITILVLNVYLVGISL